MAKRGRTKESRRGDYLPNLPWDVRDVITESILADLEASPGDEGLRMMLADRLDDLGPTWVDFHHMPNWFRLAWIRAVKTNRSNLDSWSVWDAIRSRYSNHELYGWNVIDHFGSCLIFGRVCLVTEPYNGCRDLFLNAMRDIAMTIGCGTPVACGRTAHASDLPNQLPDLVRGLIIPGPS